MTKPKYKVGDLVYSYQNPGARAPINRVDLRTPPYEHAYRLSLPGNDGYNHNSKWINESSLSKIRKAK